MKLLLIHGAGASPLSWRTFEKVVGLPCDAFSYDVSRSFQSILEDLMAKIEDTRADCLVSHSFGGLLAWHAARLHPAIFAACSASAPWGGSLYAEIVEAATLGLLPSRFFENCRRTISHSVEPRTEPVPVPWMNIVTTRGVFGPPNDGVLTVDSQMSLFVDHQVIRYDLDVTHSEVLHATEFPQVAAAFFTWVAKGLRG